MSQVLECCKAKNFKYEITYKDENGRISTGKVCSIHWSEPYPIKFDETTTKNIKIFQIQIIKLVCISCNQDVTETKGCNSCNTIFEKSQDKTEVIS